MRNSVSFRRCLCLFGLIAVITSLAVVPTFAQKQRTPSDTVREFYKAMRERKFREAFGMSIYKPAIEGLKPEEFEDLRPEFEKLAAGSGEFDISGEQISGEAASVFIKFRAEQNAESLEVPLIRVNGTWIVGDKESQSAVIKAGKDFFFTARIDTHHSEVQAVFQRVSFAQLVYSQQHNGQYGNMSQLIAVGLLPKDLEGSESTGYIFHINLSGDAKSWSAAAEPAQYGRTGRLSFFLDQAGVRSADKGGKPLPPQ
jgi:hypothetical protein